MEQTIDDLVNSHSLHMQISFPDRELKRKFLEKVFDKEGFCVHNNEWSEEHPKGLFVQSYVCIIPSMNFEGIEFDYD